MNRTFLCSAPLWLTK